MSCESAVKPIADRSAIGSSSDQISASRSTGSSSESSSSWCSVPSARAVSRATGSSLSGAPEKPTENVCTGRVLSRSHQRDDEARVEPSAQHRTEGNVAHQAEPNGVAQQVDELLLPFRLRPAQVGVGARVPPVLLDLHAILLDDEAMTGQELPHVAKERPRAGDETERQQEIERLEIEVGGDEATGQDGFQLRAEDEDVADLRVVERLLSEAIADEQRPLTIRVPDGEREHPDQRLRHVIALGLVEVGENLRVAPGREDVAVALEPTSNRLVVVELAVLRGDDVATFVRERLVTVDDVDDAQPPHADRDSIVDVIAGVVGTSMPHRRGHRAQRCKVDSGARFTADLHDSTNPAHGACDRNPGRGIAAIPSRWDPSEGA